jgi:small subunit ribosomal protein S17
MTDAAETGSTSVTETGSTSVTETESTSVTETGSTSGTGTDERNARKVREGVVTSNSMDRTAVVTVTERKRHRKYDKTMRRDKNLYVHDAENDLNVGDRVRVMETRPLSKTKRWRVVEVLERAR